ncbi:MAG: hypothetical protein C0613_15570 [Desulfobulbaceae bacterium]|nr:MAG: hypothetical protein C0613_15570 [Desulfobulbaceae bacterium]
MTVLTHPLHLHQTHACRPQPDETRIGEILVQENLITPLDCKQVLEIQEAEKNYSGLPFLRILTDSGRLSTKKRNRLLALPDIEKAIADTASRHDLLTRRQLELCLLKKNAYQTLPEALVAQNLLSEQQLDFLLHKQLDPQLVANQAITMGIVSAADVDYCHKVSKGPRPFGEICCSLGLVTPLDLYHLLAKHGKQVKFGEILIHLQYTDEETVNTALGAQKLNNKLLGEILIEQQVITPEQCQEALSLQANIPFERLEEFSYDDAARQALPRLISARHAEEHLLLPLSLRNRNLKLALMHPDAIQSARELLSPYKELQIQCILVPEERFRQLFEELYSEAPCLEIRKTLLELQKKQQFFQQADPEFLHIDVDEDLEEETSAEAPHIHASADIEEAVHAIIRHGLDQNASDIHLEPEGTGLALRYRIDGIIKSHAPQWLHGPLHENAGALIARLKVMANLDSNEKRLPQDGAFRISYLDEKSRQKNQLEFRVASCPSVGGESITIHILDPRKAKLSLRQNGHRQHVLEPFTRRLNNDSSIVLVAGPNGSGKSSTLYGALKEIYNPSLKILTAEDPIEYNFPGIIQSQVNNKLGLDFARLLRSFLRLDPDVIMVGELRDQQTAALAFDAAQTGHLVLSSLYANDSICALFRLLDLGIDRSRIAANLSCVLAQRLVRKICPSCLTEYQPEPKEWSLIFNKYPAHLRFFHGTGCRFCDHTGFKGRTVLSEIFTMNNPHAFIKGAQLDEMKEIASLQEMKTMVHDGLLKMNSTTLTELSRVLPFTMLENHRRHERLTTSGNDEINLSFPVRDPGRESAIVMAMHRHFNALLAADSKPLVDQDHFQRFICDQHDQLCATHGVNQVLFTLKKEEGGPVEILAQPRQTREETP